ncbi:MAG: hypothetical protein H6745_33530 [Deltaproteobacteria bacterium]|nr:hypothetical protein [Deltaproteobacteria bacterium]
MRDERAPRGHHGHRARRRRRVQGRRRDGPEERGAVVLREEALRVAEERALALSRGGVARAGERREVGVEVRVEAGVREEHGLAEGRGRGELGEGRARLGDGGLACHVGAAAEPGERVEGEAGAADEAPAEGGPACLGVAHGSAQAAPTLT